MANVSPAFKELVLKTSQNVALQTLDTNNKFAFSRIGSFSTDVTKINKEIRQLLGDKYLPTLRKELNQHPTFALVRNLYMLIIKPDLRPSMSITREVIYRFANISEIKLFQPLTIWTTRLAYDQGLLNREQIVNLPKPPHYCFYFIPAKLRVNSSPKIQIGLREYLGLSKGMGGQILGFQEYNPGELEAGKIMMSNIGTIFGAYQAFREDNRVLFVTAMPTDEDFRKSRLRLQKIEISGKYPKYIEEESRIQLSDNLTYVPGIVKQFKAGLAMPEPNKSEINFVGDFYLDGYMVEIHQYYPEFNECNQATIEDPYLYAAALEIFNRL